MKFAIALGFFAIVLCLGSTHAGKPDIVLITIDDLNDWVGCLGGHSQARTPNLDRLAKRGVLFTNAHCQAPICNPSRVSLFTGLRPSTSEIYDNSDRFRKNALTAEAVTLPQHLSKHGYQTLGCGKLFHGSKGTDEFQVYGPSGGQGPFPPQRFHVTKEASRTKLWDWGAFPPTNEEAHDFINATWAAEQLRASAEKPRFLGIGFYRPHVPCYAPPEWIERYPLELVKLPAFLDGDGDDLPPAGQRMAREHSLAPPHDWFVETGKWKSAVAAYLASVEFMDHCLGLAIDALEAGPNAAKTWIFLTGDHGWHLGEKEHWAKRTLWERSTRVPMIVVPPSQGEDWARGRVCAKPVEVLSFFPTITEVAGIPANEAAEGRSLTPLLRKNEADWPYPALTTHLAGNHAVRSERWRYIRYADGSEELYDHENDANEWANLAKNADAAQILADHRKWLP